MTAEQEEGEDDGIITFCACSSSSCFVLQLCPAGSPGAPVTQVDGVFLFLSS